MTKEQEKIFNTVKNKYGMEKANDVINNWDEYNLNASKYKEDKALLGLYHKMIENNKRSLTNIAINGEYFNNKQSSFYSNKKGLLVFEDETTNNFFETKITYDDFKIFVDINLDELAEVFVYIDTSDMNMMSQLSNLHIAKQIGNIC